MFWFIKRKRIFYDPDKCEKIIAKYNPDGGRDMQILRALATGDLNPSDIKRYYNYGRCYPSSYVEEYRLINQIVQLFGNKVDYIVRQIESGSFHSKLDKVELTIEDGVGYIKEYWVTA